MVHLQKKVGTDLASEVSTPRHPAHGVVLPEVGRSRPPQAAPKSWPMLEVRELTKRYYSIRFLKIPFTCSFLPGKANITVLGVFYWFAFTTYAYTMASLEAWMLRHPLSLPFFFGLAIPALAGLVAYRNRILDEGFTFTYEDDPEPAVRRLNLND